PLSQPTLANGTREWGTRLVGDEDCVSEWEMGGAPGGLVVQLPTRSNPRIVHRRRRKAHRLPPRCHFFTAFFLRRSWIARSEYSHFWSGAAGSVRVSSSKSLIPQRKCRR